MTFTTDGGAPKTAAVVRAVGSRRYQQYLAREGDALWRLPVAFNLEENRWFPMTGAFLFADDSPAPTDPGRPMYGGGVFDRHVTRWNDNCVFCHNVAPNPGRDPETGRFETAVAELGIACESCHGPGGEHVARNADPLRRYALHLAPRADPRSSTRRACRPPAPPTSAGAATASGSPTTSGRSCATAIRSWPATTWRSTARRSGATRPSAAIARPSRRGSGATGRRG